MKCPAESDANSYKFRPTACPYVHDIEIKLPANFAYNSVCQEYIMSAS